MDIIFWILVVGIAIWGLIGWVLYIIQRYINQVKPRIHESWSVDTIGMNRLIAHTDDLYKVLEELVEEIRADRENNGEPK